MAPGTAPIAALRSLCDAQTGLKVVDWKPIGQVRDARSSRCADVFYAIANLDAARPGVDALVPVRVGVGIDPDSRVPRYLSQAIDVVLRLSNVGGKPRRRA